MAKQSTALEAVAKQNRALEAERVRLAEMIGAKPPKIVTEEGRLLATSLLRVVELMLYNEAKTEMPGRHHV